MFAFLAGIKLWLIAGAAVVLLVSITLYVRGAEKAKARNVALEQTVQAMTREDERKIVEIAALNQRIKDRNAQVLADTAREQARLDQAQAAANEVRKQRDRIASELAAIHTRFREQIEDDKDLQTWVAQPVPPAVWNRLRDAAGQNH